MATLYVTDFVSQGQDSFAHEQASAIMPQNQHQTFATSASSAAITNPISNNSTLVRVHNDSTAPVAIRFGTGTPTALTTDIRMAPNQTEYFCVPLNSGLKVAAIVTT